MKIKLATKKYKIKIVDHILDSLYGQIGITEVERKLERLPLFKRLHSISQLGLTNWIFPCALHTRYVHSLGVMETAYNMALHINKNNNNFFDDTELQIIRLAGLLHDIGHYPLSHNIEAAYTIGNNLKQLDQKIVGENVEELIGCPSFLCTKSSEVSEEKEEEKFNKKIKGSLNYHHEAIGNNIIVNNQQIHDIVRDYFVTTIDEQGNKVLNPAFKLISKTSNKFDPDIVTHDLLVTIGSMIAGSYECAFQTCHYEYQKKYSAMLQLIHSEMDADNLDYLLRDATFSGTSYGTMDVDVLMNCLTVKEIKIDLKQAVGGTDNTRNNNSKFFLVGIKQKGIGCVDQFFQNKYLSYAQMIYSKYVSILEAMILCWATCSLAKDKTYGINECAADGKGVLNFSKGKETSQEFLHFTDAKIFQEFYDNFKQQDTLEKKGVSQHTILAQAILSRLNNFTAFEVLSEMLFVGWSEEDLKRKINKHPLYIEYKKTLKQLEKISLSDYYYKDERSKNLFAFRFEHYCMTKQLPLSIFLNREINSSDSDERKIRKHFYRLANGIPIIEDDSPEYDLNDICGGTLNIPKLIVDSDSSFLQKNYSQQLVYLRKYDISDYLEKK